ncbi:aspartate aminotransferase family protein [Micromonospora sp. C95]|uniref:aspartate aminotransferase family protein n=1 Tax=Micromonospora sp. C95 TaxID=2824882 RepID=UPI001B390CD9|nr:aminotransferase class III-fold pyridoxal phosphate-dependent enzyme [Micromonospora sp. C95]MBQ1026045.1 aminotransferase class III-fold pyridoxal phosphate-dependent enzyme [Micromonospora sp. C95]
MTDPVLTDPGQRSAREVFQQLRKHMQPGLALAARISGGGAVESSANGARITLSDGQSLLDFGSYAVTLLGHRHAAVVAAVRDQLDRMTVSSRVLANPATAAAAAALVEYLGGALPRTYFGLNGSDVVEAAVKLARLASNRNRVLAVVGGFHGKTMGALALTHNARYKAGLMPLLPAVTHIAPDDPDAVAREIATGDVAAVVFEPIQGENGVWPLSGDILAKWAGDARRNGVFVIADEIQTGLSRAGEPALAIAAGLPVNAVLVGKALGGGVMPVSALVCDDELYAPLLADPMIHTATFAGNPLACAAASAALDAIDRLTERGREIAATMAFGLAELQRQYGDLVVDVRGQGLLWGLQLASAKLTNEILTTLVKTGLIVSPCMSRPEVLRLLPPLVATDAELAAGLELVDAALNQAATSAAFIASA